MTRKSLYLALGMVVMVGLVLGGCSLVQKDLTGIEQSKNRLVPLDDYQVDNDTYKAGLQNVV